jgi:transposase
VTNRIKGLLASQGLKIDLKRDVTSQLDAMRLWDGSPLSPMLRSRLEREWAKAQFLRGQLNELERQRLEFIREGEGGALDQVRKLLHLKGIGPKSAWLYVMEFFSWREFKNGKQVGALAGLAPTPYQSGDLRREHGICKAGNKHVRTLAIEIAWCWLRHQPESALTLWFQRRYGSGGPVAHKIGVVAVARKLLVALWRYLDQDVFPEGALLKTDRLY